MVGLDCSPYSGLLHSQRVAHLDVDKQQIKKEEGVVVKLQDQHVWEVPYLFTWHFPTIPSNICVHASLASE